MYRKLFASLPFERGADAGRRRARTRSVDRAWLAIGVSSLVVLALLTLALANKVAFPFDRPLLSFFHGWDGNPDIWKAVAETANIPLIVIGFGFVGWLFVKGRRREAVLVLVMLAAVTAGSEGVKQFTLRVRPVAGTASGIPGVIYSYPSGHVLEALTILGSVALRLWRSTVALAIRLAVAIGTGVEVVLVAVARMAIGAHYPTDVVAGLLGGLGALGLYAWFTRPGAWADEPPRRAT